jgi:hypothetical protein
MKLQKRSYHTGVFFPAYIIFSGGVLLLVALILFLRGTLLVPLLLTLISLVFITGHHGLEIDPHRKTYREYLSFCWLRFGTYKSYRQLSRIMVHGSQVGQTIFAMSNHASVYYHTEYDSYLYFDNGTRIHLLTRRSKEKLMQKVNRMAADMEVSVQDLA